MSSSRRWHILNRALNGLLVLSFVMGVFGFAFTFMVAAPALVGIRFTRTELPIGLPGYVFVDGKGRIYCHSDSYDRLQVYDREGRFISGWPIGPNIVISAQPDDDTLHVLERGGLHVIYDLTGREIKTWRKKGEYRRLSRRRLAGLLRFKDAEGNRYTFHSQLFRTTIAETTPEGERSIVVRELWRFVPIRWPFPVFMLVCTPLAVWATRRALKARRARRQSGDEPAPEQTN